MRTFKTTILLTVVCLFCACAGAEQAAQPVEFNTSMLLHDGQKYVLKSNKLLPEGFVKCTDSRFELSPNAELNRSKSCREFRKTKGITAVLWYGFEWDKYPDSLILKVQCLDCSQDNGISFTVDEDLCFRIFAVNKDNQTASTKGCFPSRKQPTDD